MTRKSIAIMIALAGSMLIPTESTWAQEKREVGDEISNEIDTIFARFEERKAPGCAVGVSKDGKWLHKAGYGYANLDYEIPIDPDSVFRVASLSKQFTAAAVAVAAEEGVLELDVPIGNHISDLHPDVHDVTPRQIIGHIGGLPDFEDGGLDKWMTGALGGPIGIGNEDYFSTEEFFRVTTHVTLLFQPEERYRYSNIGYFWLSQLVEKATGMSLKDYADQKLFKPLGMEATFFNDSANSIVPRRATGYKRRDDGGDEIYETNLDWVGDGGLYTSVNDFYVWDQQFEAPTLGAKPAEFREALITPISSFVDNNGDDRQYAFGLILGETDGGEAFIQHRGVWVGFRTFYRRFPNRNLAYWIFCNRSDIAPSVDFAPRLEDALFEE